MALIRIYAASDSKDTLLLCDDCAWQQEKPMGKISEGFSRHPQILIRRPHIYQYVSDDQTDEQFCEECGDGSLDALPF